MRTPSTRRSAVAHVSLPGVLLVALGMMVIGPAQAADAPGDFRILASEEPVLGAQGLMGEYGKGWGKVRPAKIYNGGVPSGYVYAIHWRKWGKSSAIGSGLTSLYKPGGGYYNRPGTILLRAYRLGSCSQGRPAYTRLRARWAKKPQEPVTGKWHRWGPVEGNICRWL